MIFRHPDLICAFSRRPQNMSLDYGDTADTLLNRKAFLSSLNIAYQALVCAKQAHGTGVKRVNENDYGRGALSAQEAIADCDALVTDKKNLPLGIFTADCLSVFVFDPKRYVIADIHAGWRGTRENICAKTINLMSRQFNSKAADLYVGFGPAIGKCCYQVGEEFKGYFPHSVETRGKRYFLDLPGENLRQLLELGVRRERISGSRICTCCQNRAYFSFRKQGQACGRIMSVIMLK